MLEERGKGPQPQPDPFRAIDAQANRLVIAQLGSGRVRVQE